MPKKKYGSSPDRGRRQAIYSQRGRLGDDIILPETDPDPYCYIFLKDVIIASNCGTHPVVDLLVVAGGCPHTSRAKETRVMLLRCL